MNLLKKIAPFEIALIIVILSLHLYAAMADPYAFPNHWFVRDDAYYYFKVAQNIALGNGSTFDGINFTNGYHPLWMLICIPIFALAKYDLILPLRILLVVIAVIQAATSIMIYRLVKTHISHAVAILAAIFWSFNYYIHSTVYEMGLETPIAAFSVVLVIYALSQFEKEWRIKQIPLKHFALLGLIAAIAMFSRLDLIFLAVIAGIWVIFRKTPIRYFAPLDIAIIFLSMTSAVILRTGFKTYNITYASSAVEATLIALLFKLVALYFFGAYQHPRALPLWKILRQIFFAVSISTLAAAGVYIFFVQMGLGRNFPRSAFALDFAFSLILISASRIAAYWFTNSGGVRAEAPLAQFKFQWKTWLKEGAAFYGVVGGLLLAYMLFNHFTFGTSSPVSGQVKRWWGNLGSTAYDHPASDWASYFGVSDEAAFETTRPFTDIIWQASEHIRPIIPGADMVDDRFFAVFSVVILLALTLIFFNKRRSARVFTNLALIPLLAGSVIQILSYTATAYGGAKEWYWVTQMILLTLVTSLLLDLILRPIRRAQYLNAVLILAALFIGVRSANRFWHYIHYAMPQGYFPPDRPLMEVVAYIEENTFPGEIIGMTGGGNVGYFIHDRTIVNMDGLINSYEYFHALQAGEAPVYLLEHGVTAVFANPRLMQLPPYFGQFSPYFERYSSFGGKDLLYLLEEPKY